MDTARRMAYQKHDNKAIKLRTKRATCLEWPLPPI